MRKCLERSFRVNTHEIEGLMEWHLVYIPRNYDVTPPGGSLPFVRIEIDRDEQMS
tara:strand:+ start:2111 stop:2275 length:165 start_codon:yes stop_codon:yes gene_type:complete